MQGREDDKSHKSWVHEKVKDACLSTKIMVAQCNKKFKHTITRLVCFTTLETGLLVITIFL